MRRYREIYIKHYGPIPEDWDVHHKDGNKQNNHWSNLEALSKPDHYKRHLGQGEYGAARAVLLRMDRTHKDISRLATKQQLKRSKDGTHHFLGGKIQGQNSRKQVEAGTHNFLGGKIQGETMRRRVSKGIHHWLGSASNQKMLQEGKHPSQKKLECPHCKKIVDAANSKRWHFDNCKRVR